jgi:hypothetical protein
MRDQRDAEAAIKELSVAVMVEETLPEIIDHPISTRLTAQKAAARGVALRELLLSLVVESRGSAYESRMAAHFAAAAEALDADVEIDKVSVLAGARGELLDTLNALTRAPAAMAVMS